MKQKSKSLTVANARLAKVSNNQALVASVLKKSKITMQDIEGWPKSAIDMLYRRIAEDLTASTHQDYDNAMAKYYHVCPEDAKNQIWDKNHSLILSAIEKSIRQSGIFPTKTKISNETGLSRNTIQHHLKRYAESEQRIFELETRQLVNENLMSCLLQRAYNGDVKAARLYMEATGLIKSSPGRNDNSAPNYIQVNGTSINQTFINQLPDEILNHIEAIIKQIVLKPIENTMQDV